MEFLFNKFKEEDFPEYKSWYADAELNTQLGPMDEEWLEHVLHEEDGDQYSVYLEEELIAVIGTKHPKPPEYPEYYITDIAVKPIRRREGVGTQVLAEFLQLDEFKDYKTWRLYISETNPIAIAFFTKNGWKQIREVDEHGMMLYEFTRHVSS